MVDEVDANKNGTIDFDEFVTLVARRRDETEEELREAFDIVAETKDGEGNNAFISHDDLKKMMDKLCEKKETAFHRAWECTEHPNAPCMTQRST